MTPAERQEVIEQLVKQVELYRVPERVVGQLRHEIRELVDDASRRVRQAEERVSASERAERIAQGLAKSKQLEVDKAHEHMADVEASCWQIRDAADRLPSELEAACTGEPNLLEDTLRGLGASFSTAAGAAHILHRSLFGEGARHA